MADLGPLASAFFAHLTVDAATSEPPEALEEVFRMLLVQARTAWPTVHISDDVFLGHLASRVESYGELSALHAADLYLACGCVAGIDAAIVAFEHHVLPAADGVLARMDRTGGDLTEEVKQILREELLVGTETKDPKIIDYRGRGPLRGWVKVAASRKALDGYRKTKREVPLADWNVGEAIDDGEIGQLKGMYRRCFRQAFERAFTELSAEERNLLRRHILDELGIDALATLYGAHRATVARRLGAARAHLATETRRALGELLGTSGKDLDSVIGMVRSRLDLSLRRILKGGGDGDE